MPEEGQIRKVMAKALQMKGVANAKNFEEYWTDSVGKRSTENSSMAIHAKYGSCKAIG